MGRVLLFAESVRPGDLRDAVVGHDVVSIFSRRSLISHIVDTADEVVMLLLEVDPTRKEEDQWLRALHRYFPVLKVAVVTNGESGDALPEGYKAVPADADPAQFKTRIRALISQNMEADKRRYRRYDWPLRARLTLPGGKGGEYRIRTLSAGGAFLERGQGGTVSGSQAGIEIFFGNFTLTTTCEILAERTASSNLPDGFGIHFDQLSDQAREVLDRIVHDALAQVLLEPDEEPEVPSLDEDDFALSINDEFSLS